MARAQTAEPRLEKGPDGKQKRLSATRYYTMKPFTMPLLVDGNVEEQFTIVIALEMYDSDARVEIRRLVPKVRNNLYEILFRLVTFRRRGSPIPDIDVFKNRLLKVVQSIIGKELIKDLLVQQAFRKAIR